MTPPPTARPALTRRALRLVASGGLASALALAACGGTEQTADQPSAVTNAGSATSPARSDQPGRGPGSAPATDPVAEPTTTPATTTPATTVPALVDSQVPAVADMLEAARPLWRFSMGDDRLGVWICRVGLDVEDNTYNRNDFRLALDPEVVAGLLQEHVAAYFSDISHGMYRPEFSAGGEVSIGAGEGDQDCVAKAQAAAPDDIDGLIVIADAEHASSVSGGWGRPGKRCRTDLSCPANLSGRATYIGASDFHPDWGAVPAVDLEEHEIGHSLGLPHSGDPQGHDSAIDLMSNSAAPRDTDPDRRHGPDILGVDRLALGWMPLDAVGVAGGAGTTFTIAASNATDGQRLIVLPIDDRVFITVEAIANTGYNDHLPTSGIAIHRIDQSGMACRSVGDQTPCRNESRRQVPLHAPTPYTDLLTVGSTWSGEGWTVTVLSADDGTWTVQIDKETT